MPRLNIERQQQLEPERIRFAVEQLTAMGYEITSRNSTAITFDYKGSVVTYFPYSGWHTGKTIIDGRGWSKLKRQLRKDNDNGYNT